MRSLLSDRLTTATTANLIAGFAVYRSIVVPTMRRVYDSFHQSLVIDNETILYYGLTQLLDKHRDDLKMVRKFQGTSSKYSDEDDEPKVKLVPGDGAFILKLPDMPRIFGTRSTEKSEYGRATTTYTLRIMGSKEDVERLAQMILDHGREAENMVRVYEDGHWWRLGERKNVPALVSDVAERMKADVARFLGQKDNYAERNVPYRRGYLLEGPPGTGKSNLIAHLACHFDMQLFLIGEMLRPMDVLRMMVGLEDHASSNRPTLLVLEDADMSSISVGVRGGPDIGPPAKIRGRVPEADEDDSGKRRKEKKKGKKTDGAKVLRTFLNNLDGIVQRDNFVFIATTNGRLSLDKALLRPGRIDQRYYLGPLTSSEQRAYLRRYYGNDQMETPELPDCTIAALAQLCTRFPDDPASAVTELKAGRSENGEKSG